LYFIIGEKFVLEYLYAQTGDDLFTRLYDDALQSEEGIINVDGQESEQEQEQEVEEEEELLPIIEQYEWDPTFADPLLDPDQPVETAAGVAPPTTASQRKRARRLSPSASESSSNAAASSGEDNDDDDDDYRPPTKKRVRLQVQFHSDDESQGSLPPLTEAEELGEEVRPACDLHADPFSVEGLASENWEMPDIQVFDPSQKVCIKQNGIIF
jgi:hypothetical protein